MTAFLKLVVALELPDTGARDEFVAWARSEALGQDVGRAEVEQLVEDTHRAHTRKPPRFSAFASLWLTPDRVGETLRAAPGVTQWFRVRDRLAFDRSARPDEARRWAGVKKTTPWAPVAGVDPRVWQGRYTNHGVLAGVHHATAVRYRQNVVEESSDPELGAISELWWTDTEDLVERFYASDDARELVAIDTLGFVDATRAYPVVTTHEVLRTGDALTGDAPFLVGR